MLSPKSVFITGCNRGIGLELVKHFLRLEPPPSHVFATCRAPENAKELQTLAAANSSLTIVQLDQTEQASIDTARSAVESKLGGSGLNLLINNAAVGKRASLEELTAEDMIQHYRVNCAGPLMVAKAALNMVTKNLALELKADGILATAVHPGWVKTDMGGLNAHISTEESVTLMLAVLAKLQGEEGTGKFYHAKGHIIGW